MVKYYQTGGLVIGNDHWNPSRQVSQCFVIWQLCSDRIDGTLNSGNSFENEIKTGQFYRIIFLESNIINMVETKWNVGSRRQRHHNFLADTPLRRVTCVQIFFDRLFVIPRRAGKASTLSFFVFWFKPYTHIWAFVWNRGDLNMGF